MTTGAAPRRRLALVGTGYIGGSLALALKRAGVVERVVGADVDLAAAHEALARGVIDEIKTLGAVALDADVVALAAPVGALPSLLQRLAPSLGGARLVFDVGSTKRGVLDAAEAALGSLARFVGAHPIAGKEHRGPAHADPALFEGRPCLLVPGEDTARAAVDDCRALWTAVGARVIEMDAATHDRVFAVVSHLPHTAAFALGAAVDAALAADPDLAARAAGLWGGGFADTTRITASNPAMWRDILVENRDALAPLLDALAAAIDELRAAIAAGDRDAIAAIVERAGRGRSRVMGG